MLSYRFGSGIGHEEAPVDSHVDARTVGSRIRQLRHERGWSAQKLADECARLGMSSLTRGTIAKIESGSRAKVPLDEVVILARALGITPDELLAEHGLTILHLSDLMLGPGKVFGAEHSSPWRQVLDDLCGCVDTQLNNGDFGPKIDLVLVSGGLTIGGMPAEFDVAREFLEGLTRHLGIGFDRVAVVPGNHEVNLAACRAYFADCDADEMEPVEPYWPKWRHFTKLFQSWPEQGAKVRIEAEQPWSLFEIAPLKVVVAGLNSTIKDSHRQTERFGWVGEQQAEWFADQMERYRHRGWLRVGMVHHHPLGRAGSPEEDLRDAANLDERLGRGLNLLVHGHGDDAAESRSGLPVLGAGSPAAPAAGRPPAHRNTAQLLRVHEDGFRRVACLYDTARERWMAGPAAWQQRAWADTHATFPRSAGHPPAIAPAAPSSTWHNGNAPSVPEDRGSAPPHGLDARRTLLDSIVDVCVARHAGAVVQRIDGQPPYLRVTYSDGDVTRQFRIGACAGRFDQPDVDAFLARVHAADPEIDSELVYQSGVFEPPATLRDYAMRRGVRLRSFTQFQGLLNLGSYVAAQTEQLRTDRIYPPAGYVPQRYTDLGAVNRPVREDLVKEMLRTLDTDDGRFLLLLGDFGRGKTFALRELARRIPEVLPRLTPIFIELRTLDKAHTIEGLVAAHLANHRHDEIDLKAFRYMLSHGRIVLIFDGFDELVARATYARAAEHLQRLLAAAEGQAKIVVASRTQHFQTHAQVLSAIGDARGLPQRRILSVEDLSPEQIRSLLVQRYGGDAQAAQRRLDLLGQIGDLVNLARNPRMLGFIADLDEDQLRAVVAARGTVSAAALYGHILNSWLRHEEARTQDIAGVPVGLGLDDLWVAVTRLAIRMWESDEALIGLDELGDVARTLTGLAAGHLSAEQIAHAVGAGSLLWRTDEGLFGFIHGSVMEWLIARHIADLLHHDPDHALPKLLEWKPLSLLTIDFVAGLADPRLCQEWIQRVRRDAGATDAARSNASRISARLSSYPQSDMRGAVLSGQDLTLRSWHGIDLTEADLAGAQLSEADLSGATLCRANLAGAVLDRADLTGADLTGADLTGASLVETTLTGARLDGARLARARFIRAQLASASAQDTRWRRAALVNVLAEQPLLDAAQQAGAAVIPGQRVENATMPATVGVLFGFQEGRLPRPVAFDADGGLLAIGNEDGTVLVCDAESSQPLRSLVGHEQRTYAVMYSPTEPVLATGSLDRTVRLWNADTGECTHVLTGSSGWVWPMLFSTDGSLLAAGDDEGTMRIWSVADGSLRATLRDHRAPIWTATFHASNRLLAVGDEGGGGRIWDLETGTVRHELNTNNSILYWLRFDRDSMLLAGGGDDGVLRVWNPDSGELTHELVGHTGSIYAFDFDSTGGGIVSADTKGTVLSWDLSASSTPRPLDRHEGSVYRITFSPAGKYFASGDSEGAVRLWEAEPRSIHYELTRHHASVWPMMFRPDGERLVTSSNDFTTKVWNTVSGNLVSTITGHNRSVWSVTFSNDGAMLATTSNDGRVRLWNPRTGRLLREIRRPLDRLISAVFSAETSVLATATNDGRVLLWDTETGEEGRHLEIATDDVWAAVFNPDGTMIAAATDENTIQVLYRKTGRTFITLGEHRGRVRALAFSPDGRRLAAAGDDSAIRLWDWERGTTKAVLSRHTGRVYALAFHPHHAELASASTDETVLIWDLETQTVKKVIEPGQGRLWSVAYHPGGAILATAGDSGIIDIWDAADGSHRQKLAVHLNRVWSVAFSPDGGLMASSSSDGTTLLWSVEDGAVTPVATLIGMRDAEWVAFTPDGRHKGKQGHSGDFWHIVGMSRFEAGELAAHIPQVTQLDLDAPLF
ncbi:WD40 domain-containing protein [Catellatospora vulcania]|uniref:WD40 domain-containing protein n=1 Tax=Catellatospora vulcania TaxID=1460450 RepID=UPI0012D44EBD|nr:pentapeptide repeat-containing protein [Catellatospora vulcania]